jgi:hypothetical protein
MSRKDRRRAAAARRQAKPLSKDERRNLISRIGFVVLAALAAILLFSLTMRGGI